jgi:phospholipase D1/2
VFLTRFDENGNPKMDPYHRFDVVLKRKADQGVKIFVLPWSETKIAIDLGSANVKTVLEALSPNIKVLCHPLTTPIKWSHHQKTVIVDQKVAFVGGLDLCFGRWDSKEKF